MAPSGAGIPLAPEGQSLIPTHQVTIGFIRREDTLTLTWHLPESSYQRIAPEIQATLDSLRLTTPEGVWNAYSE